MTPVPGPQQNTSTHRTVARTRYSPGRIGSVIMKQPGSMLGRVAVGVTTFATFGAAVAMFL